VEASVSVDSEEIEARQSVPIEQSDDLSVDIVRYVERTQESLVVNDAADGGQFFADPYVVSNRPKSILCMPIVQKKITTGVLYLENNLATDVFTKGRIEILNIILAQAAISLDNAKLYENLREEVAVRKQAEERVLHLATAMEQAAEGILITELDGTIIYTNPACETIYGYGQEEIQGKKTQIFKSGYQDEEFFDKMGETLLSGKIWRGQMSCKKKGGGVVEVDVTVSPIKDDMDQIISFVSVSRDITQEIQMERELRQAQKMEAIGTLAGGIAHDFNNILAAIMGYTELATFQAPEESPVQVNLERVIVSTKRAKDLVRQILTFSRQTDQEIQPVQMKIIIKEALRMLRATLPSTIEFKSEILAKSDYIFADPTQIHQIMMNLCTNAAHSMESGGLLTVRLEEYLVNAENHDFFPELTPGPYICLTIKDTGHGIDEQIIERIFEPFFTTKEPGKGTGMGLAMIHGVVASCEGAIRVNSEIGKGTKFQVLLPKYEGQAAEAEDSTPEKMIPGKERILFVDDEITLVTLAEEGLKRMGYIVHLETDSIKALEKFKQDPKQFDLIITDQTMPKMTGIELSKAIIKIRPDIPIILYSGMLGEISPAEIEAIGIRGFLSKPLLLKQLSRAIRDVLDRPDEMFVR
jgi:PAS domain S-box-containing protein